MEHKFTIAILGIGGVGGYIGGKLAKHYAQSNRIKIIFIARGETGKVIKKSGLKIIDNGVEEIVHPSLVSDDANEIGKLDLLICCTKTYSLGGSLEKLKGCIAPGTIILPLQNGVNAKDEISGIFPGAKVIQGCVYMVAKIMEPGVISRSGKIEKLYFGDSGVAASGLKEIEVIFKSAGIDATLSSDISAILWSKCLFISPVATLTSAMNMCIGAILADENLSVILTQLMKAVNEVAVARNIVLPADVVDNALAIARSLPYDTYSSMHTDVQKGGDTEINALTKYMVDEGHRLHIPVPEYTWAYEK